MFNITSKLTPTWDKGFSYILVLFVLYSHVINKKFYEKLLLNKSRLVAFR